MIKDAEDFIAKLINYYSRDDVSLELSDGLKDYVRKYNFKDVEMDYLYSLIKENCGHFPIVKTAKSLWEKYGKTWNGGGRQKSGNAQLDDLRTRGYSTVIATVKHIYVKQQQRREADPNYKNPISETEVLLEYTDLYNAFNRVEEVPDVVFPREKKDIYYRKMKETVDEGKRIDMSAVNKAMEERERLYHETYGTDNSPVIAREKKKREEIQAIIRQYTTAGDLIIGQEDVPRGKIVKASELFGGMR